VRAATEGERSTMLRVDRGALRSLGRFALELQTCRMPQNQEVVLGAACRGERMTGTSRRAGYSVSQRRVHRPRGLGR
jgi:hypothetical protein